MAALAGDERVNHITSLVIGAAIRIHRTWGPGLLERAYLVCLCQELRLAGLQFELERPLPLTYLGSTVDCSYRADLIVERIVLVELKAIDVFAPAHTRQLVTYTKLAGCRMGLLLNFGAHHEGGHQARRQWLVVRWACLSSHVGGGPALRAAGRGEKPRTNHGLFMSGLFLASLPVLWPAEGRRPPPRRATQENETVILRPP